MKILNKSVVIILVSIFSITEVLSQNVSDSTILNLTLEQLMKVKVISASRTEQEITETSANVSVITADDIELSGATNITDLLRNIPGLDVMSGWASGIDVGGRGLNVLENSKTLVLINGQRVNNDYSGSVRWLEIPIFLNNIERIEVITSPLSALYGANSFSALINIITKPTAKLKGINAVSKIGNKQSQTYQIGYGNSIKKFDFRFDVGFDKTEGWGNRDSLKIKETVLPYSPPGTTDSLSAKIKDWYEFSKATIDVKYNLNAHSNFNFLAGVNFGQVAFPDLSSSLAKVTDNHFSTKNYRTMLGYSHTTDNSTLNVRVSSIYRNDLGGFYESLMKRYDADVAYSRSIGNKNLFVTGVTSELLIAESPSIDKKRSDKLLGIYLQDEYKISKKVKFTTGIRFDKHTNLGWQYSPRFTMNIKPVKNHYFRIGVGQAFRKPSFLENYCYKENKTISVVLGMENAYGSSKPEKITSYNFDYQNIIGKFETKISFFKNYITDLINTKKVQPYSTFDYAIIYENYGKLNVTGGEFEIKLKPSQSLQFFANTSYQIIDYETEITSQKISVPEIKGNVGEQLNLKSGFFADAVLHYTGKREAQYAYIYALPDNTFEYYFMKFPQVAIVDLNLGYKFKLKQGSIVASFKCFNIFNTRNIEYAVFDSNKAYFGLDTPVKNLTEEQKIQFENRNALHDRKFLFSLKFNIL